MDDFKYSIKRRLMILESMIADIYDAVITEKKVCPICMSEVRLYLPLGPHGKIRRNARCPVCFSHERHRTLWVYMKNRTDVFSKNKEVSILHFGPEKCFYDTFMSYNNIDYYPVDYNPERYIKKGIEIRDKVDMQNIQYQDKMFDVIILCHVLEHIPDEKAALSELKRVLKTTGEMYIMVPMDINLEQTLENLEYNTDELRRLHYGQPDHLRLYGRDFASRLEEAGLAVTVVEPNKDMTGKQLSDMGLVKDCKIFVCNNGSC